MLWHIVWICIRQVHVVNILLGKQTIRLQTPDRIKRIARCHQVFVSTWLLCLILDFILVQREGSTNVNLHLTNLLGVIQRAFKAPGINDTGIYVWSIESNDATIGTRTGTPDIRTALEVAIQLNIQASKESSIDTNIVLISLLMSRILCCHLTQIGTTEV